MRGLIFDLDDTIFPRAQYVHSGFRAVASYVASSWRRERETVLAALFDGNASGREGEEFQFLCERCRLPMSLVPALVAIYRGHTPVLSLDPQVRATLDQLKRQGWRLVLLTNGDPGVQRRKVAALGLDAIVDDVVYAEEHAPGGKPNPAVFAVALERLRVSPSRCVCVGNDPECDVAGARRVGLKTIRVVDGQRRVITSEADAVIESVIAVPAVAPGLLQELSDAA